MSQCARCLLHRRARKKVMVPETTNDDAKSLRAASHTFVFVGDDANAEEHTITNSKHPPEGSKHRKEMPSHDALMNADMPKELVEEARELAMKAFEQESQEKAIASFIKREFERKHRGIWHCIVGKNFGSFVTHETKNYIYFYVGQMAILLWKSVS